MTTYDLYNSSVNVVVAFNLLDESTENMLDCLLHLLVEEEFIPFSDISLTILKVIYKIIVYLEHPLSLVGFSPHDHLF